MKPLLMLAAVALCSCQKGNADRSPEQALDSARLERIEQKLDRLESRDEQLPAPLSKSEMDAIPDGTKFLAPDGTVRVKITPLKK